MIRISVCITSYNGGAYLEKQLSSIIKQISNNDEIIISDDGSTDNTIEIIKGFNDPRIKLFNNYKGNNLIDNFENALTKASGEYIFLSDQDDIWETDKIDIMLGYLQQHDLVVSDCSIIDLNDNIIQDSFFKLRNSGKGILKNIKKNSYMGCCMAFNRFVLEKALPLPKKMPMHDWWIGIPKTQY
jgi:glycosyltransferase involved in cell wall biosynthesis